MAFEELDMVLLEEVLSHIHNWFKVSEKSTSVEIADGALPESIASDMLEGQFYRIQGSLLNDGLHRHVANDLEDETFDGTVAYLAIPRPLLYIVFDIQAWNDKNGEAVSGPYASESFGGYSYTLKTDSSASGASGGLTGWRLAFRERLNPWRKMY